MTLDLSSFYSGFVGGLCGVGVSHGFDTVRVIHQETRPPFRNVWECAKHIHHTSGFKGFYRGLLPPLVGVCAEKCVLFGFFCNLRKHCDVSDNKHVNTFLSGMGAGVACTTVVTPVEKLKIILQNQSQQKHPLQIIKKHGLRGMYNGWTATLFREVP